MIKFYTVKSNARRDARKAGLDPDTVKATDKGFVIGALAVTPAPAPSPQVAAVQAPSAALGKRAQLLKMLRTGWQTTTALESALGWLPHTVRGAISGLKKSGVAIERQRADGVTSYRADAS